MVKISIVIPVKNGEATLRKCINAIVQQSIASQIEIIVLDSMSTDNSRQIAQNFAAKIIEVPNGTFNHGLTRNLGVQYAQGELIYFTVQDAYLSEKDQLQKMVEHFQDNEIAAVNGIQGIPDDFDKNPAIWFERFTVPEIELRYFPGDAFSNLSLEDKFENSRWDNVNAMYRKSALQTIPFHKTDFAEDAIWAKDALMHGFKLVRDPSLLVYHYHYESFNYSFKKAYVNNYIFWKHFNVLPGFSPFFLPLAKNLFTLFKRKRLSLFSKIKWAVHNFFRLLANLLSVGIFRFAYLLGKQNLLDKSYHMFCSKVPQGIIK